MIDCFKYRKMSLFLGGVLSGTAGMKTLGSDDTKKLYINCLAAGSRAKNCAMTAVSNIQENTEGILTETREINAQRCQEVFGDESRKESPEHTSEYLGEDEIASADTVTVQCIIRLGKKSLGGGSFIYSESVSRTVEDRSLKQ